MSKHAKEPVKLNPVIYGTPKEYSDVCDQHGFLNDWMLTELTFDPVHVTPDEIGFGTFKAWVAEEHYMSDYERSNLPDNVDAYDYCLMTNNDALMFIAAHIILCGSMPDVSEAFMFDPEGEENERLLVRFIYSPMIVVDGYTSPTKNREKLNTWRNIGSTKTSTTRRELFTVGVQTVLLWEMMRAEGEDSINPSE